MLQYLGKDVNSKYDLFLLKAQIADFIKPLKFGKADVEKFTDLMFELTKALVFNMPDAYMYLNHHKQERRKGLEIYLYNKSMTIDKMRGILNINYCLGNESIISDRSFFDNFELMQDPKLGAGVHIIKWQK
jgi:hypothetical protein